MVRGGGGGGLRNCGGWHVKFYPYRKVGGQYGGPKVQFLFSAPLVRADGLAGGLAGSCLNVVNILLPCREENKWCREENNWCREENNWCREEKLYFGATVGQIQF